LILCFRIVINNRIIITNDLIDVKIEPEDTHSTESTTFSNCLEKNKFICYECYDCFDDFEEFVIHKNLSHTNKPYVCHICKAQFVLSAHLNLHFAKHDNNYNNSNITKFHKCDFCLKIFQSFLALNDHLQYDTHRMQMY